jgi:DNA-binding GntR family transcriptional regulator
VAERGYRFLGIGESAPRVPTDLAERIRAAIVAGELMPNQHLVEAELAKRYRVGRAAVRLALARLEEERLVVREPNKGARVRAISLEEAIEITEVRAGLEVLIAEKAALRAEEEEVRRLEAVLGRMRQAEAARDIAGYSQANRELHQILYAASRHPTAIWMLRTLRAQVVRWQFRIAMVPGRMDVSVAEHAAIVGAVARRDPEGARAAMEAHMASVLRTLAGMPKEGLY